MSRRYGESKRTRYNTTLMATSITGEARVVGKNLINRVTKNLLDRKTVVITSGETTVTVQGNGQRTEPRISAHLCGGNRRKFN